MKKGTGTAITFALGVFAGLTLCGPAAQAATNLTATLSNQPIYVDGQRVSMTAYQIGGNNYVRLRDIGQAVDFAVDYDPATNSVYITSDRPSTGGDPTCTNHALPLHRHHRGKRTGFPGGTEKGSTGWDRLPHALLLHQQWSIQPRHPLLRLGHTVQRCRLQ